MLSGEDKQFLKGLRIRVDEDIEAQKPKAKGDCMTAPGLPPLAELPSPAMFARMFHDAICPAEQVGNYPWEEA